MNSYRQSGHLTEIGNFDYQGTMSHLRTLEAQAKTPILFATTTQFQPLANKMLRAAKWRPVAAKNNPGHTGHRIQLWLKTRKLPAMPPTSNAGCVYSSNYCCGLEVKLDSDLYGSRYLTLWERPQDAKPRTGWRRVAHGCGASLWVNSMRRT